MKQPFWGESAGCNRGLISGMKCRFSVMGCDMDGYDRDGGDGDNHGREQDEDEPCGAVGGLWRGLGDPHGVDKGVRNELNEFHVFPMVNGEIVAEITEGGMFLRWLNRKGLACIYLLGL
jgi:hypothetical protein